jgi:HD-GYP domain-containing protein (c-di-GMP phosphodiesterase class II)
MPPEPIKPDTPLYSSRIVDTYIKLLKRKYTYVDIDEIIDYAGMKAYQVADQGHWFTQKQIDRFYSAVLEKCGNPNIAREAGQYAASPEALGVMRQFALGLIGPAKVYEHIGMTSSRFTKSAIYESRKIDANTMEITVTPREGAQEQPFQCENRLGFWEAVAGLFGSRLPRLDHPQCIFKGDKICRYIISWESQSSAIWKTVRNWSLILALMSCVATAMFDVHFLLNTVAPISGILFLALSFVAMHLEKKEFKGILSHLQDNSNELMEQIESNYNNSRLTNEIGETITSQTNIEDVLNKVVQLFRRRLNYDRCLIMLSNPGGTRLVFRAGYGYSEEKLALLKKSAFHLDRPDAKGIFVACYREQKPYLINDLSEIGHRLSARSVAFSKEMGSQAFICCPIICEGKSLGILAVDNVKSKKPLLESDLSLLLGLSHVIGISVRNVELLDARDRQMQSILQTLAASIDARDPLTAGHSTKVTEYAMGICRELGLPKDEGEAIRVSALLHDYGKIGVPDSILKKPGRLTREEYEIVKTHALKSRQILDQINFTDNLSNVPEIAGAHHEKIDGSGYPLGLKGDEIPLGARIIAVADFFEAITAKRHYRDPLPMEVAFQLLDKERGVHFEERIVDAFKEFLEKNYELYIELSESQILKVS